MPWGGLSTLEVVEGSDRSYLHGTDMAPVWRSGSRGAGGAGPEAAAGGREGQNAQESTWLRGQGHGGSPGAVPEERGVAWLWRGAGRGQRWQCLGWGLHGFPGGPLPQELKARASADELQRSLEWEQPSPGHTCTFHSGAWRCPPSEGAFTLV